MAPLDRACMRFPSEIIRRPSENSTFEDMGSRGDWEYFLFPFVLSLFRQKLPSLGSLGGPRPKFGIYQEWILEMKEWKEKTIAEIERQTAAKRREGEEAERLRREGEEAKERAERLRREREDTERYQRVLEEVERILDTKAREKAERGRVREMPLLPQLLALFSSERDTSDEVTIIYGRRRFFHTEWELLQSSDDRIFFLTCLEAAVPAGRRFDLTTCTSGDPCAIAMESARGNIASQLPALLDSLQLSAFKCQMRKWGSLKPGKPNMTCTKVRVKPWGLAWDFSSAVGGGKAHYLYAPHLKEESLTKLVSCLTRSLEEDRERGNYWLNNAGSLRSKMEADGVWDEEMSALQAAVQAHKNDFGRASHIWNREKGFEVLWGPSV
mmetsp:Transcript_48851/g.96364  ORF Transcript_48851/g.96364 Transcript_48851/m.96364 type:complete len:383 (+) Transcript_48851:383-1531(+)